jgi:hypothetical protein
MFAAVVVFALFSVGGCSNGPGVASGTPPSASLALTPTKSPTAVPTADPSFSISVVPLPIGSLDPETTYRIADRCCVGPAGMYLTTPAGWETIDTIFVGKNVLGDPDLYDILLGAHLVGNVYTGGCHWQGTALDPPVGPTVDDLATALAEQGGPGTSAPTDVTIGGLPGKKVELSIPDDVDIDTCDRQDGFPVFGRWSPGLSSAGQPWTWGKGQHDTVYIVDVDGTRQVIDTMYLRGTTPATLAELDQILASIRFEP